MTNSTPATTPWTNFSWSLDSWNWTGSHTRSGASMVPDEANRISTRLRPGASVSGMTKFWFWKTRSAKGRSSPSV